MDKEKTLKEIQKNIALGRLDVVSIQIDRMVSEFSNDPFVLLTCASLLKTTEEEDKAKTVVLTLLSDLPEDEQSKFEVATGLMHLGFTSDAISILRDLEMTDKVLRTLSSCLHDTGKNKDALSTLERIQTQRLSDDILKVNILISLNQKDLALSTVKNLIQEFPEDYDVRKCYCFVLLSTGYQKDAERFIRSKTEKNSIESLSLMAYYMWISGKISAAAGYAVKVIKINPSHLASMEILAYCLIEKNKIKEAKIVAGAINETYPGNAIAFKILESCKEK